MLKKKLQKALRKAGLNEGLADHITVNSEAEIKTIIAQMTAGSSDDDDDVDFDEIISSQAFTDYVEENGFDELLKKNKAVQSGHDKKVTQGIDSFKAKILGGKGKKKGDDPEGGGDVDDGLKDAPAWAKSIITDLAELKKGKSLEGKKGEAEKVLNASTKIPTALKKLWAARLDPESETSIEDQVKAFEEEYKLIHIETVGDSAYEFAAGAEGSDPKPGEGGKDKLSEKESKELAAMAKNL